MAHAKPSIGLPEDTKTIITILCLLFAFPIGVILMWIWNNWPLWLKIAITAIPVVIIILVFSLLGFIFSQIPKNNWHTTNSYSYSSTDSANTQTMVNSGKYPK